ncbi:MAG: hypothetical protein HKN26_06540 [Acidimicrobiales bacterium]|nr:hypothetical protein [Acidimicrobiales bacterium]
MSEQASRTTSMIVGVIAIIVALALGWWVLGFIRRILRLVILIAVVAGAVLALRALARESN